MATNAVTKQEARTIVKQKKREMKSEEILKNSKIIFEKIVDLPEFQQNDKILTYVSYNQEVETHTFITQCIAQGKEVYVPKVHGKVMKFHRIHDLSELKPGTMGILEPVNEPEEVSEGLMIMPGLAFDISRNRVGYGGGFYDKYLENHSKMQTIAVCFDVQIFDEILVEAYDLKPEMIVTETRILC